MNLTNLFKIAFKALSNNKLRGFLTMLGIIIGVGSVITMLAIGQGSKRSIQAQISEMGSNMIMIHPGGDRRGGVRLDAADMESLKLKDLEAIQTQARYISYISPSVNSSGQAIFRRQQHADDRLRHQPGIPGHPALQGRGGGYLLGTGRQDRRQGMSGGQIGRGRAFSGRRKSRG